MKPVEPFYVDDGIIYQPDDNTADLDRLVDHFNALLLQNAIFCGDPISLKMKMWARQTSKYKKKGGQF
ncbi:MAG: hypothetical protein V3T32_07985 [Thermodesulfobacteriota bacterium]